MTLTFNTIATPVDILSFSVGAWAPSLRTASTAIGFQDAYFTATESAGTPTLLSTLARGQHFTSIVLRSYSPVSAQVVSDWTFSDVTVNSLHISRDAADITPALTTFSLFYNMVSYRVFAVDGSVAAQVCWNLITKVPC